MLILLALLALVVPGMEEVTAPARDAVVLKAVGAVLRRKDPSNGTTHSGLVTVLHVL